MRHVLFALGLVASLAPIACSSSSAEATGVRVPAVNVTGAVNGKAFKGKTAIGFVNATSDTGIDHQTIFLFDGDATCDNYNELKTTGRYVTAAFNGGAGTTTKAPDDAKALSFVDYGVSPPYWVQATGGSAVLDAEAKVVSQGTDAGFDATHGHVTFAFAAGQDQVSGEADYVLCF